MFVASRLGKGGSPCGNSIEADGVGGARVRMAWLQGRGLSQDSQQADSLALKYTSEKGSIPSDVRQHIVLRRCHPNDGLNPEVSRFMLSKTIEL